MATLATPAPARVVSNTDSDSVIFGWESLTDVDPGEGVDMRPVGIQLGTGADANKAVAFISTNQFSTAGNRDVLTIVTEASVTALNWGGRLNSDGSLATLTGNLPGRGRITQANSTSSGGTSYQELSYAGTRSADSSTFQGDMNGNGALSFSDLSLLGLALNNLDAAKLQRPDLNVVQRADFNLSGAVTFADLRPFGLTLNGGGGIFSQVSGDLASAAVPEPTTCALAGLALASFVVTRHRSRRSG